jgi:hypothetical protein
MPPHLFPSGLAICSNPREPTQHLPLVLHRHLDYILGRHSWGAMELDPSLHELRGNLCDCLSLKKS